MLTQPRDVFLCHASQDKAEVLRPLVDALTRAGISYWYDEAEILWGDSITQRVNEGLRISRYVVVILSEAFLSRNWPQRELNAGLNLEASSGDVRVLPLLVGNEAIIKQIFEKYPILNDKFYLNWDDGTSKIIESLKGRLLERTSSNADDSRPLKDESFNIPLPEIKKKFTQRDKDLFLKSSFPIIKSYFKKALKNLQSHYPEAQTDFTEIHNFKFISTIYIDGEVKSKCKIWLGGPLSPDSIAYYSGHFDIDSDNSCNGWLTVSDDGSRLGFEASNMPFQGPYSEKNQMLGPGQAAECLWRWFTETLNQK